MKNDKFLQKIHDQCKPETVSPFKKSMKGTDSAFGDIILNRTSNSIIPSGSANTIIKNRLNLDLFDNFSPAEPEVLKSIDVLHQTLPKKMSKNMLQALKTGKWFAPKDPGFDKITTKSGRTSNKSPYGKIKNSKSQKINY